MARHQYSSGQRAGRRDIYVRSDLQFIYGQKRQRRPSVKLILAIVLILIVVVGCVYVLFLCRVLH